MDIAWFFSQPLGRRAGPLKGLFPQGVFSAMKLFWLSAVSCPGLGLFWVSGRGCLLLAGHLPPRVSQAGSATSRPTGATAAWEGAGKGHRGM